MKKYMAEGFGTAVLVLLGCGSAVLAGTADGNLHIAMAFGLAVVAMAYTIGSISGCHINPAVTIGFCVTGRMQWKQWAWYIVAQIIGGFVGALALSYIASKSGGLATSNLGQNMIASGYTVWVALAAEVIATMIFVRVVLGATSEDAPTAMAGLVIGLTLAVIHIVFIPVTGTSVNPARSLGPALLAQWQALADLWIFIVWPVVGAVLAGLGYTYGCSAKK